MGILFDDGSSEYLYVDSTPVTEPPFSMHAFWTTDDTTKNQHCCWIGDKDSTDEWIGAMAYGGAEASDEWSAHSRSNADGQDKALTVASPFPATNRWYSIQSVFTAVDDRAVYRGGQYVGTNTNSNTAGAVPDRIAIGALGDSSPGGFMSGRIAEVAIWNAALTAAEFLLLGVGVSPLYVRPGALAFYLPMYSIADLTDVIGGRTMTAVNAPVSTEHPYIIRPGLTVMPELIAAAAGVSRAKVGRSLAHGSILVGGGLVN